MQRINEIAQKNRAAKVAFLLGWAEANCEAPFGASLLWVGQDADYMEVLYSIQAAVEACELPDSHMAPIEKTGAVANALRARADYEERLAKAAR